MCPIVFEDGHQYVHNRNITPSANYLYNPENNIELGCAYLSKIMYVYFENVNNIEKKTICSVPSYNTGVGNVAKALSGYSNLTMASRVVNKIPKNELNNHLLKNIESNETKDYIRKVWSGKTKYQHMID